MGMLSSWGVNVFSIKNNSLTFLVALWCTSNDMLECVQRRLHISCFRLLYGASIKWYIRVAFLAISWSHWGSGERGGGILSHTRLQRVGTLNVDVNGVFPPYWLCDGSLNVVIYMKKMRSWTGNSNWLMEGKGWEFGTLLDELTDCFVAVGETLSETKSKIKIKDSPVLKLT